MADPVEHGLGGVRVEVRHIMDRLTPIRAVVGTAPREPREHAAPSRAGALPAADRLDLSPAACPAGRDRGADAALQARIAEIRQRIAEGTYLTSDKLDKVAEELRAEIFGH